MIDKIVFIINSLFNFYFWLILFRCLLSFIPTVDWYRQPFMFVKEITDAYLNLFRKFIPPFNGLDLSPIVAIIVLQILQYAIIYGLILFK